MTISFSCDNCGKQMQAPDDKAGKSGKCPACGERITVPSGDADFFNEDLSVYDSPMSAGHALNKPCPMCGDMIPGNSTSCPTCGERLDAAPKKRTKRRPAKSGELTPESTVALQLLITGILGCFSPILSIYGIIFLIRHPEDYPRKSLAVAGTVLHCFWTGIIILSIIAGNL